MSLYKGTNLISGHQVLYSTTGNNTDGAMTQSATTTALNGKADTTLSNVSSIDSNSAVQTALNSKVNTADIWYNSSNKTLYIGVPQS